MSCRTAECSSEAGEKGTPVKVTQGSVRTEVQVLQQGVSTVNHFRGTFHHHPHFTDGEIEQREVEGLAQEHAYKK